MSAGTPLRVIEEPEAVWFSGGSLQARYGAHVRHMEPEDALRAKDFWQKRATELGHLPTLPEARHAARRWMDLTYALDKLDAWNRAVGKPSPYAEPESEPRKRLCMTLKAAQPKGGWAATPYDGDAA